MMQKRKSDINELWGVGKKQKIDGGSEDCKRSRTAVLKELSGRHRTCETCGAVFGRPQELRRHSIVHQTGAFLYKCQLCSFESKHKVSFRKHMDFHQGKIKLVKCPCCPMSYRTMFNLKRHLKDEFDKLKDTIYKLNQKKPPTTRKKKKTYRQK